MGERFEDQLSEAENAFELQPRSALEGLAGGGSRGENKGLRLEEAGRGVVLTRCDLSDQGMSEALASTVGAPPAPGEATQGDGSALLRLGEDELWALTKAGEEAAIVETLRMALGAKALVEPITDGVAMLRLGGDGARETLAKGAAIDLHPKVFGPGAVRRAGIGPIEAVIYPIAGGAFDVFCRRSQAAALYRWLNAAGETGALPGAIPGEAP